ncbi:MAG TPA: hypothetical protein DD670_08370 [Planctomycetaceae bacterium]|nr:hypothetical protein [Planctomycetaceae bacterium]
MRYRSRVSSWTTRNLPGVLLLVLFVATAHLAVRRGVHRAVLNFWPEAMVIVAGLAWWLWLSPSVLGLVVVLAGFWRTVRRLWPKRRKPSSVVISVE